MERLRRCQKAKQFISMGDFLIPCEEYPNCLYCPPTKLSSDKSGTNYDCERCGAKHMQLWDVPPEKLKAPDVVVNDFMKALKHSHVSVSEKEMEEYAQWTKQFGQDGA